MGTWKCIDGIDQATWEYVSLEIVDDLKRIPDAVSALLPGPVADDSAWTRAISRSMRPVAGSERHYLVEREAA
ncbi:MAG TPA: hypothetical protein VKX16_11885 [Chloroflexota bacterium]|nr:hypothetical protein [Chloroflexota bacterium]